MAQVFMLLLLSALPGNTISAVAGGASDEALIRLDVRDPYFALESRLAVGDKGEETLDVSIQARCGESAWVFQRAELQVRGSRFGAVQFVSLPSEGCTDCAPIRLRWYHEPTGYLSFTVHVYRRLETITCDTSFPRPA